MRSDALETAYLLRLLERFNVYRFHNQQTRGRRLFSNRRNNNASVRAGSGGWTCANRRAISFTSQAPYAWQRVCPNLHCSYASAPRHAWLLLLPPSL